jgi:hypothetical protein
MRIERTSPFTGEVHTMEIDVTQAQLDSWRIRGELIQDAMPHLSADEREFIKTGITPQEWEQHLGR